MNLHKTNWSTYKTIKYKIKYIIEYIIRSIISHMIWYYIITQNLLIINFAE